MDDYGRDPLRRFLNQLKILRSLDLCEVPNVRDWPKLRDNPAEYLVRCDDAEGDYIWQALLRREPKPEKTN